LHAEDLLINMVARSGQQPCGPWAGLILAQPEPKWLGWVWPT